MSEFAAPDASAEGPAALSQQGFLLRLSDALQPLADPVAIEGEACRLLGEALAVDRAYYVEVDEAEGLARVARDWVKSGGSSLVGAHRVADFGWSIAILRRGACHVVADTRSSALVPPAERPAAEALQIIACMGAPLVKGGRLVGALCVTVGQPREWAAREVALLREVGERIWAAVQRARAEEALAASEAQYRTLFDSIDEGFCTIEVLFDGRGEAVDYRFLQMNSAFARQTGLEGAVGRTILELAPQHEPFWFEVYGQIARSGEARRFEHGAAALGRYYEVYAFRLGAPHEHRVAVLFKDILARKQAEASAQEQQRLLEQRVEARTRELADERAALDAFVAYSETVGTETDVPTLAQRAVETLRVRFGDCSGGYYERLGELWQLRTWTEDLNAQPGLLARLRSGITAEVPSLAALLQSRAPTFTETWDPEREGIADSEQYGSNAAYPLLQGGELQGFFTLSLKGKTRWSERDRAVFRAVGRSLTLALERTEQARALADERAALDAFVRFSEATAEVREPLALAAQAEAVLRATLDATVGYAELEGGLWKLRLISDNAPPELAETGRAGLPADRPIFARAARAGGALFVSDRDAAREGVGHSEDYRATAFYAYRQDGRPQALLSMGLPQRRPWTEREQQVFRAVGRSLQLALERSEAARRLAAQAGELARSNAALQASNEELEAFNHSVSHDLMTPVRHVEGFAHLAAQHLADPARARHYLDIVGRGAQRMATLIEAMLTLSRTGRRELSVGAVDLNALAQQARLDALPELSGRAVEWQIGALPVVRGDRVTLQQVMTNLLENAVKFSRDRDPARIAVWAEQDARGWTVFVRDNGAGFDPRYADKLFGIFQRLHRHDEFEGTGVGLSLVRRIIARHGGTVGAVGALGQGATFHFTLPRTNDAPGPDAV